MQVSSNPMAASIFAATQPDDTGSNSSSSSSSATITANDFLQLLVTEMQNQDPTANTDPNEYINQLVQVNSLEQLVQINQDLGGSSTTGDSAATNSAQTVNGADQASTTPIVAPGNLSAPNPGTAASRVASALGTASQTLAPGSAASPLSSVLDALRARAQSAHTSTSTPSR